VFEDSRSGRVTFDGWGRTWCIRSWGLLLVDVWISALLSPMDAFLYHAIRDVDPVLFWSTAIPSKYHSFVITWRLFTSGTWLCSGVLRGVCSFLDRTIRINVRGITRSFCLLCASWSRTCYGNRAHMTDVRTLLVLSLSSYLDH
jgi:hypothetical protein